MKIKIYDKYIFNQVLGATLACVLLFIIVWIAPETLLKIVKRTLKGTYEISVAIQLLIFEVPKILNKALPIGIFLGSLYTFDKLSKDSEVTIFRNTGLSSWRIIAPVIVLGAIVTVLCFFVNDKIGPYSCNKLTELKNENPRSNFVYIHKDKQSRPKQIIILPEYTKLGISEPVIMNFSEQHYSDASNLKEIIIGENASISPENLTIHTGKKYSINDNGIFKAVTNVKNYNVLPKEKTEILHILTGYKLKRDRDLTNAQLWDYMMLLKAEDLQDDFRDNLNKYLQRYFHSFMCLLFAILGCFLGFSQPREQRLIGFGIAIVITFLYYITLPCINTLAEKNFLHPLIAASIHPILLAFTINITKKMKDV